MSLHRAKELVLEIYWANEQPKIARSIDNLLIVLDDLMREPPDAPFAFWIGREGVNPLDGARLWDNS